MTAVYTHHRQGLYSIHRTDISYLKTTFIICRRQRREKGGNSPRIWIYRGSVRVHLSGRVRERSVSLSCDVSCHWQSVTDVCKCSVHEDTGRRNSISTEKISYMLVAEIHQYVDKEINLWSVIHKYLHFILLYVMMSSVRRVWRNGFCPIMHEVCLEKKNNDKIMLLWKIGKVFF